MDLLRGISITILLALCLQSYLALSLPHEHIKSKGQDCEWKYANYNVSVNLTNLTDGLFVSQVSGFQLDGQNKTIMIGFCRGMNMTCEGKNNKGTAACLINKGSLTESELRSLTANNSTNIGHISKSHISVLNHRLIYETVSYNKTCASNDKNVKEKLAHKTRLEFYCSNSTAKQPTFDRFDNCTYYLHWPSIQMCKIEKSLKDGHAKSLNVTILNSNNSTRPSTSLTDRDLKINLDPKPKTALELHEETLAESKKFMETSQNISSSIINGTNSNSTSTIKAIDKSSTERNSTSGDEENHKKQEKVSNQQKDQVANKAGETSHVSNKSTIEPSAEPQINNKIGKMHKVFMIGLILVCLAGFVTGMIILDRKTSFGAPLGEIRRRARQALHPEPVPYTRVDRYNDCLNL